MAAPGQRRLRASIMHALTSCSQYYVCARMLLGCGPHNPALSRLTIASRTCARCRPSLMCGSWRSISPMISSIGKPDLSCINATIFPAQRSSMAACRAFHRFVPMRTTSGVPTNMSRSRDSAIFIAKTKHGASYICAARKQVCGD